MLKFERQNEIMNILNEMGSILVTDLSEKFNCSDETIRRDLKELEDKKLLNRTHGGAFISEKHDKTYPAKIRNILYYEEKVAMAKKAMEMIIPNDYLFLDSSTSSLQLAKEIIDANINVTIITNSISICNLAGQSRNEVEVILLGGVFRRHNLSTMGLEAYGQIKNYYADKAFISPPKISLDIGLTDNNINEAYIRKSMLERSNKNILLVDHTKFKDNSNYLVANVDEIDTIITDLPLSKSWQKYINNHPSLEIILT